jgi:hypothetical protein
VNLNIIDGLSYGNGRTSRSLLHIVPFCEGPNEKPKGFAKQNKKPEGFAKQKQSTIFVM